MNKFIHSVIISSLLILISWNAFSAQNDTYCDMGFGWHFYCDEVKQEEDLEDQKKEEKRDYKAELEQMQQELESKKVRAIIDPTSEHVRDYMTYQQKMLEKASTFSDVWARVLWENPYLDYTLKVPTNTMAKHKWIDEKRNNIVKSLKSLNERYGLFFVYRSTCPYCHKYSPVIKNFGEEYGVDIVAISADGLTIKGWENNTITDIAAIGKLGIEIKAVPATILYDSQEEKVMSVGFGILSRTDLENRIYILTNMEKNE